MWKSPGGRAAYWQVHFGCQIKQAAYGKENDADEKEETCGVYHRNQCWQLEHTGLGFIAIGDTYMLIS